MYEYVRSSYIWMDLYGASNLCINIYGATNLSINSYRASDICMNMYRAFKICMNICGASNLCINSNGATNICMNICGATSICMNIYRAPNICRCKGRYLHWKNCQQFNKPRFKRFFSTDYSPQNTHARSLVATVPKRRRHITHAVRRETFWMCSKAFDTRHACGH